MTKMLFASWIGRSALSAVFTLLLLTALRMPSAAADTSYLTLQGPNPVTATCPMTLTFNGSITGAPNSPVTYLWARFVNGQPQDSAPITTQIPASGTLTVPPQPLTIDKTTQGFQSYALFISSPVNSDSTTHGKVFLTATCKTLVINPNVVNQANPSKGGLVLNPNIINDVYVTPPDSVRQTGNQQDCGAHGGGFDCPLAFANNYLVLVWCWQPTGCGVATTDKGIKAFNIYEVDNGKHVYVNSTNDDGYGNVATAGTVQPPQGGFTNQCYAVTAVQSNKNESVNSNAVCLGNGIVGNVSSTYHATQWDYHYQIQEGGTGLPFISACATGPMCFGWHHDQSSIVSVTLVTLWWYAENLRAYYRFDDVNALSGHYIVSATLHVPVTGGNVSCLSALAAADTDWTNAPNAYIGGSFESPSGPVTGGLDVTDIVRNWVSGSTPNYGFVLRGGNETFNAETSACRTDVGTDATLDVVHS